MSNYEYLEFLKVKVIISIFSIFVIWRADPISLIKVYILSNFMFYLLWEWDISKYVTSHRHNSVICVNFLARLELVRAETSQKYHCVPKVNTYKHIYTPYSLE